MFYSLNKISKYLFIIMAVIMSFVSCNLKNVDSSPNILFIMADDHTSQAWGIYNGLLDDYVKNDAIKYLEKNGTVLDNMFCTNSICVPSRASILTGQYSHINGVYTLADNLNPDSLNVAKILQKNGYNTALIGKWHLKKSLLDLITTKFYLGKENTTTLFLKPKKIGKMDTKEGSKNPAFPLM